MCERSDKFTSENERNPLKFSRKQDAVRPSSILSTRGLGRHTRAASVSTTSYLLEKNSYEKKNVGVSSFKNSEFDLKQMYSRKTQRANSLPTSNIKRYSVEANLKQTKIENSKKLSQNSRDKRKDFECKRLCHQRMSLDLSQMSDFADSEGESKDRFSKHRSRRRRSTEKSGRIERLSSQLAVRSVSNSPSKVTSCTKKTITRRSSLQSFSPKTYASYENMTQNNRDVDKNQSVRQRTSSTLIRKASLGSSLIRSSELHISSDSPDYTSDPSPNENSFHKRTIKKNKLYKSLQNSMYDNNCSSTSSKWTDRESMKREPIATPGKERGEWNNFWQNYNSSLAVLPKRFFYDDCPTPFYEPKINGDIKAFEINCKASESTKENKSNGQHKSKRSNVNKGGIYLSKSEAKDIIHCAQKLAEILSTVLERETKCLSNVSDDDVLENEMEDKEKSRNKQRNGDSSKDVFL